MLIDVSLELMGNDFGSDPSFCDNLLDGLGNHFGAVVRKMGGLAPFCIPTVPLHCVIRLRQMMKNRND